jgi:hypothetical protein
LQRRDRVFQIILYNLGGEVLDKLYLLYVNPDLNAFGSKQKWLSKFAGNISFPSNSLNILKPYNYQQNNYLKIKYYMGVWKVPKKVSRIIEMALHHKFQIPVTKLCFEELRDQFHQRFRYCFWVRRSRKRKKILMT